MSGEERPRRLRPPLRIGLAAFALAAVIALAVFAALALLSDDGALRGSPDPGSPGASVAQPVAVTPEAAPTLLGEDPITGDEVALADFRGKPVVINVWASWCPGCNDEAADLRQFAADHPEIVVLGVDFQDTVDGARRFYRRWEWTHPSIFDSSGTQSAALGLFGMPTTLFLDSEHRIAARVVGATDRAGFEHGLELATQAS
ncbi:MAG: TlpA family protein disulfide reductase [Candidatus Limnocylindria bacterium]